MIDRHQYEAEALALERRAAHDRTTPTDHLREAWRAIERLLIAWGHWLDGRGIRRDDHDPQEP